MKYFSVLFILNTIQGILQHARYPVIFILKENLFKIIKKFGVPRKMFVASMLKIPNLTHGFGMQEFLKLNNAASFFNT